MDGGTNRLLTSVYDAAGNETVADGDPLERDYDSENHIVRVRPRPGQTGQTVEYRYDGQGRRVQTVLATGVRTFVYDALGRLAVEYGVAEPSSQLQYVHQDLLGSVRMVTGPTGAVVSRHDYEPFGREIPAAVGGRTTIPGYTGADNLKQRFTGKERDTETGLDYFLARYLSTPQGRFTSADPVAGSAANPQSLNGYTYVWNNPTKLTDPSGMVVSWEDSKCTKSGKTETCQTVLQKQYEDRIGELQSDKDPEKRAKGNELAATYKKLQDAKEVFHVVKNGEGRGAGDLPTAAPRGISMSR